MIEEQWLPIPGFEHRYEASSFGRIRVTGTDAMGRARYIGHVLVAALRRGYPGVNLWRDDKSHNFAVHALIAKTFLGEKPQGFQINHKNGKKTDNRVDNLEYVTAAQNYQHALQQLGHKPPSGMAHWAVAMDDAAIREIRERKACGESFGAIARSIGKNTGWVFTVCTGKTRLEAGGPLHQTPHQR